MVHGTYGPLALKEYCTSNAKHGQKKLLMCKKCFFTIGRYGSCRVLTSFSRDKIAMEVEEKAICLPLKSANRLGIDRPPREIRSVFAALRN
ncbi:hypothetical protein F2Q70_00000307 [Brassica cretica]|uniref:Uncharacterized protein n=1 Tax=Brassica cretica TaxID=69181 RepID=A0A8S9J6H2_BRACR|nr:hypothetical protein F2Q70_00000307 [Brassica cretica]